MVLRRTVLTFGRHNLAARAIDSAWAHADLLELNLLACDTAQWNAGAQVQAFLVQLHPHLATRTPPIARERAEFHARELLVLHGADSFAVKTTVRQIVRYHSWLVTLPGSLLGAIGGESELLLNILAP